MILNIDHLAFSAINLEDSIDFFRALHYEVFFYEKNLTDLRNKKDFVTRFSGRLDMALLKHRSGIGIELLNHGHAIGNPSNVWPIFEGISIGIDPLNDSFTLDGLSFIKVNCSSLGADFFVPQGAPRSEFACNKLVSDTSDLETAVAFWSCLGFKRISSGDKLVHLEFVSFPGCSKFHLFIRQTPSASPCFWLDTRGFNCLAFISTDAQKERARFEALSMSPTVIEPFRVNGRNLGIFWVRGPRGELAEIIGIEAI